MTTIASGAAGVNPDTPGCAIQPLTLTATRPAR